jgi:alpha-amylase/alpha-mannosidase (GH57 family)
MVFLSKIQSDLLPSSSSPVTAATQSSPATATGVCVTVHGHFYQPPRENPYLDAIERQASASPAHDWNERIYHECYRPNAFARILNDRGEVTGIVNNYEYLSFNIGPTLMSWLERYDTVVYQRIIEADRKSSQRLNGHGNAIAQVYNHIIMPLANERDKYTQIRWGIADFRSRFDRDPEGMWLAETAVDYATLEVLVAEGIRFIVLAPSQAERCRHLPSDDNPDPEWYEVGGGQIDPTRPYRCYLKPEMRLIASNQLSPLSSHHFSRKHPHSSPVTTNTPYIDIFFYDGPISRDMGFNDVLSSSHHLAGRLGQAVRGDHRPAQLISVATDGETFGHHKNSTEKCLAYAFTEEFPRRGWTVTNYAHYLSQNPSSWEVELKPVTAWSCSHGVDRWQDDCGCGGGGEWNQKWRRPLRDTLNWLRDQLIPIYEKAGRKLFRDPWATRDEYIDVIRDRSTANVDSFLAKHQIRELDRNQQIDALRLLEMQRHTLLMFTSCGWFFEEVSRPEGVQILRYAARAVELAAEVSGVQLEKDFIDRLSHAPSNVDVFKTGAEVYRQQVATAQISLREVAAHYAISSLFAKYPREQRVYCYQAQQLDFQIQRMGSMTLAVGQLQLTSEITRETEVFVFAAFHLGGWDFHCCIQPFGSDRSYTLLKERLFGVLQEASAAHAILEMVRLFGDQSFSLRDLFAEERHRIVQLLSQENLTRLDQLYTQVYRENYGVMMAFHRDELAVPVELQVAAEVALGHRCLTAARALEQETADKELLLAEIEAIATEAKNLRTRLNVPEVKQILERLVWRCLNSLLLEGAGVTALSPTELEADISNIERLIAVGNRLNLGLCLDRSQELYFDSLYTQIVPLCLGWLQREAGSTIESAIVDPAVLDVVEADSGWDLPVIRQLLELGQTLAVDVECWLQQLS